MGAQSDGHVPNIHDVAAAAGAAVSSVSRVLSGHPDVSEAMRQRVEAAAQELGYEPCGHGRRRTWSTKCGSYRYPLAYPPRCRDLAVRYERDQLFPDVGRGGQVPHLEVPVVWDGNVRRRNEQGSRAQVTKGLRGDR